MDRRRHQLRRLVHRIAEHDALVARTLVLVAGRIDALRNVGRLLVQVVVDAQVLPVKPVLIIPDVPHAFPRDLLGAI